MASSINKNQYPLQLNIKTDPEMWEIKEYLPSIINKIILADSIFEYFPYMELSVSDNNVVFSEINFFTEYLDVIVNMSDLSNKKFNHTYYWSEHHIDEVFSKDVISGMNSFYLRSSYKKKDFKKSKSYKGILSDKIKEIINEYSFNSSDISDTSNYNIYYQSNSYDYEFIQLLSKYAYSSMFEHSPYVAYIDMFGNFNFVCVSDLFKRKESIKLYYGSNSNIEPYDKEFRNDIIFEPTVRSYGSPVNISNYNSNKWKLKNDGTYEKVNVKLSDKLEGNRIGQNKMTIRSEYLSDLKDFQNYGLMDDDNQKSDYKGWENSFYLNSLFTYRLKFYTNLNLDLCSGKIINANFMSPIESKNNKSIEYSGNWLILQCAHGVDNKGNAITSMELGKSTLNIDKKHKFFNDFI